MGTDTRRDFLKKAGLLSAAAAVPNVLPAAIQRALAINPALGTTFEDAAHVVFLMQENRSFDHMFGTLKGVRGFNDPTPHQLPNNDRVWLQRDVKGNTFAPFHIDINKTKITWQGGLAHSWPDQTAARNNGKFDKWVPVKSTMSLAYYKRQDIPFYYALADAFTICDHYFSSSLTGTTPNRLFFWTGNVRPNPNDTLKKPILNNSQAESHTKTFVDWPTFPELLEDNGVDWRIYQNEVWSAKLPAETDDWLGNYGDNALEYVERYNVNLSAYFRKNGDTTVTPNLTAAQVQAKYDALTQREKNLIDKAFTTNIAAANYLDLAPFNHIDETGAKETLNIPEGDIFYQFRKDVNEGNLPTVSWLVAPQRFSDHTSSPLYGTWYVSEALDILTKNPEVWKKTIFIINYDENDGYFDHIPPFVVPKPQTLAQGKVSEGIDVQSDYASQEDAPIGLGYRVPMLVASPWSRGGYVNSQVFDHTSTLLFLEKLLAKKTGKVIRSQQISSWRRVICGDMSSIFRPYHGETLYNLKPLVKEQVISNIQHAKRQPKQSVAQPLAEVEIEKINQFHAFEKGASAFFEQQETGVRPACAIPYHLLVDAKIDAEAAKIELIFTAEDKSVGAAFRVSALTAYGNELGRQWSFTVKLGDTLNYLWDINQFKDGLYNLAVYGPNGFYRLFKGNINDAALKVAVKPAGNRYLGANTLLDVFVTNNASKSVTLALQENSGTLKLLNIVVPKGKTVKTTLDLNKTNNWYNFKLFENGRENFLTHYAGHLENGKVSTSDPYMGALL